MEFSLLSKVLQSVTCDPVTFKICIESTIESYINDSQMMTTTERYTPLVTLYREKNINSFLSMPRALLSVWHADASHVYESDHSACYG